MERFQFRFPHLRPAGNRRADAGRTHRNATESMGCVLGAAFDATEMFNLWERIQEN